MTILEATNIDFFYGARQALKGISLTIMKGGFYGLLGPNGSGKSTLLSILSGTVRASKGEILIKGKKLETYSRKELARTVAFVPQEIDADFPFSCREVVMMGRFAHQGILGIGSMEDDGIVERCMELTGTDIIAERPITELSGGERQRVIMAQALAQGGEVLLLDEPTSHLDIKFQLEIMELVKRLNREQNLTIIASFHDLNIASHYCGDIFFLHKGLMAGNGSVDAVFSEEMILKVFGVPTQLIAHPSTGRPLVFFRSSEQAASE
ncbi:MAG: ABC transporter ATP-binding protein [Candidatus Xenobiia bacterium LiM19]